MSFEILVRPAIPTPFLNTETKEVVTPSADTEAFIEWGGPPTAASQMVPRTITYKTVRYSSSSGGFGDPPEPPEKPIFRWNEVQRQSHSVRITQAGKPENYVDVEVVDAIAFDTGSAYVVLTFTNPK